MRHFGTLAGPDSGVGLSIGILNRKSTPEFGPARVQEMPPGILIIKMTPFTKNVITTETAQNCDFLLYLLLISRLTVLSFDF